MERMCKYFGPKHKFWLTKEARKIEKISYDEMLELASLGAKVLQIRSVEFAKKYNVDVHVRSSLNENTGTMVTKEDKDMEGILVSGVAYDKNEAKIAVKGVPDKPGIAAKILTPLSDAAISVDMSVQNVSAVAKPLVNFIITAMDKMPTITAKIMAWRGVISPTGRGLPLVRPISASILYSMI